MKLEDLVIRLKIEEYNRNAEKKSCSKKGQKKGKGKSQANIVEKMEDADDLCAMLSECNLVGNPKE